MKNAVKPILLIITFIINFNIYGQNTKPNLIETQNWIKNTITSYPHNEQGFTHNYSITYSDNKLIYKEVFTYMLNGEIKTLKSTVKINIVDIENIIISKNTSCVWLIIRVKENKQIERIDEENNSHSYPIETEIILNSSFLEKNLPERIKKAFARLIEINGGNPTFIEEKF